MTCILIYIPGTFATTASVTKYGEYNLHYMYIAACIDIKLPIQTDESLQIDIVYKYIYLCNVYLNSFSYEIGKYMLCVHYLHVVGIWSRYVNVRTYTPNRR